jgi:hypothetical protein
MAVSYQLSAVSFQQNQIGGATGEQQVPLRLRRFGMTSLNFSLSG